MTTTNTADRKTMSVTQAARHLSVSRRTIYNWLQQGKIEWRRTAGGSVRIFMDSVWLDPTVPGNSHVSGWAKSSETDETQTS